MCQAVPVEATQKAVAASQMMYGSTSAVAELDAAAIEALVSQGVHTLTADRAKLDTGYPVIDACVDAGLAKSKGEARRLIKGGGARVDGEKVADENYLVRVDAETVRVSAGKKHHGLLSR